MACDWKLRTRRSALTLLEMTIAMVIMAIVMAALLPQFRNINNSWASKQGRSEALQNARVLTDHINRNLCRAERITAVSAPDVVNGFIEYIAADGLTYRYQIGAGNNVEFGPTGNLSELGGPVSELQFLCYSLTNFETPTTDVETIRLIKANLVVVNPSEAGRDERVSAFAHLRVSGTGGIISVKPRQFSSFTGQESALARIDDRHFLCVYSDSIRGWAIVLRVNDDWSIAKGDNYRFESNLLLTPALAKIDDDRYLCAYSGPDLDGRAVVLTVNRDDWTISKETAFEFDSNLTLSPALSQIDETHYLCAYTGKDMDGYAVVLKINDGDWTITRGPHLEFDTSHAVTPTLSKIDDTHHLCAYTGSSSNGWAVVLTVDTSDWHLERAVPCKFNTVRGVMPRLARINDTRHLCIYQGGDRKGFAVVLGINTLTWRVIPGSAYEFDSSESAWPAVCWTQDMDFLCAYARPGFLVQKGMVTLLNVNPDTWTVSRRMDRYEYASDGNLPALMSIDGYHALCAYDGRWFSGTATVLEIRGGGP